VPLFPALLPLRLTKKKPERARASVREREMREREMEGGREGGRERAKEGGREGGRERVCEKRREVRKRKISHSFMHSEHGKNFRAKTTRERGAE